MAPKGNYASLTTLSRKNLFVALEVKGPVKFHRAEPKDFTKATEALHFANESPSKQAMQLK